MAFRIEVTLAAQADIDEAVAFIAQDSVAQASRWLDALAAQIESLTVYPSSSALILEAVELGRPLRSVHFHSHRIVYEVDEGRGAVTIVRVWHGARRHLRPDDLG